MFSNAHFAAFFTGILAAADAPLIGVDNTNAGCFVFNRFTTGAVVAFRRPNPPPRQPIVVSVTVPGGGKVRCSHDDVRMENAIRLQFIDHGVAGRPSPHASELAALGRMSPEELRRALSRIVEDAVSSRVSETGEAREQIAQRRIMAQLELEQRLDELQFRSTNAVNENTWRHTRQALMARADPEALKRHDDTVRREQTSAQVSQAAQSVMYAAAAYAAVESVKRAQLNEDAKALKGVLKDSVEQRAAIEKSLDFARREAHGTMAFHDLAVASLDRLPRNLIPSGPIRPVSGVKKLYGEKSGKTDLLEVEMDAPAGLAVVYADVRFDRGGSHRTLFRRLTGTRRWQGEIAWPVDAHLARLTLRHPFDRKNLDYKATLSTGRIAPADAVRDSEEQFRKMEKQYKRTTARAQGSDGHRTIPTP